MAARNPKRRHSVMAPAPSAQPADGQAVTHALVEAATNGGYAPSIHNTQPWRWRIAGKSLDLYAERRRTLDVVDPDTRLAILSCGAALHHARVSLAAQGWHAVVTRMPDPGDRTYLAQPRVDERTAVESSAMHHLRTITLRHTDRRPVSGARPAADVLKALSASVEAEDSWLHILNPDQVLDLATAAEQAQRIENEDSAWKRELAYWTGGTRPDGTGIPDDTIPDRVAETTVPGRDFGHAGDLPISSGHDKTAAFALLYGRTDGPASWLRAGEALSAAWLTATEQDISVLPLSAPIEVVSTRQTLRAMIANIGYPFLILRLGTVDPADAGPPHAPRLPAAQTIERS